jgi:EAL domain-containing protein (putative c-di-GMP-specific phosphodiesterase class I)
LRTQLTSIWAAFSLLRTNKVDLLSDQGQRLLEIGTHSVQELIHLIDRVERGTDLSNTVFDVCSSSPDLEFELRRALLQGDLQLHYQPILKLSTGEVKGFEALARWLHPTRGWIPPSQFIPAAECSDLILTLGQWVLRNACQQMQIWRDRFPSMASFSVSVNLAPKQLEQTRLVDQVHSILQSTGFPPEQLHLEVTESDAVKNYSFARSQLLQLQALGIKISLDDFGTGYSSLSCLNDLPIDILKIDRSFIQQNRWEMVQIILMLAHRLGLLAIAEGVETVEQYRQLQVLGCDYGQGYFFSRPLSPDSMTDWITSARIADRCLV